MSCSVSARDPVEQLPLDIQEKTWGSNPEHFVVQPAVTQLLFDHNQPSSGVLCRPKCQLSSWITPYQGKRLSNSPDSSGRLEADPESRPLVVVPDGPAHDQPHGQGGVHPLLAGAGLDEVRAGHHADQRALVDVVHGAQLSDSQDGLHVSGPTGLLHGNNLARKQAGFYYLPLLRIIKFLIQTSTETLIKSQECNWPSPEH